MELVEWCTLTVPVNDVPIVNILSLYLYFIELINTSSLSHDHHFWFLKFHIKMLSIFSTCQFNNW